MQPGECGLCDPEQAGHNMGCPEGAPSLRRVLVEKLIHLLTIRDVEERRLIGLARDGKLDPWDERQWGEHDMLERRILYKMARATDPEIKAAIDEYDALVPNP